jgi:hypothetical protein
MKYLAYSLSAKYNGFARPVRHSPALQEIVFRTDLVPEPGQIIDLGNGILATIRHLESINDLVLILPDKAMYCIQKDETTKKLNRLYAGAPPDNWLYPTAEEKVEILKFIETITKMRIVMAEDTLNANTAE